MELSSIALQGMQQAQQQVDNSARRIASAGLPGAYPPNADSVDLSTEAVSLLTAKSQFGVNVQVLKVADEMQKSLINLVG